MGFIRRSSLPLWIIPLCLHTGVRSFAHSLYSSTFYDLRHFDPLQISRDTYEVFFVRKAYCPQQLCASSSQDNRLLLKDYTDERVASDDQASITARN
ncbi:hypothetical protein AMTRI_Chr04g245700 [Amborella trichopoda]